MYDEFRNVVEGKDSPTWIHTFEYVKYTKTLRWHADHKHKVGVLGRGGREEGGRWGGDGGAWKF